MEVEARGASRGPARTPQGVPATSKRTKAKPAAVPLPDLPPAPRVELIRRLLLVVLVTLVVARPIVGGEQPGMTSDFADPGSLGLVFLTLLAATAWAGWRMISGQEGLRVTLVDLALLALGVLVAFAAGHAAYRRTGWAAGWDWLGVILLILLVRQVLVTAEDRYSLVAVLLASLVSLSAEGLFQSVYAIPQQAAAEKAYNDEKKPERPNAFLRDELTIRGVMPTATEVHDLQNRLDQRRVHGPYFYPESLATALALAVPLLAAALVAGVRGKAPGWQRTAAAICLFVVIAALLLTRAWLVLAILTVVGVVAFCLLWPRRLGGWVGGLVLAAVLCAPLLGVLGATGLFDATFTRAADVWSPAWRMAMDHFWGGVGPAQFPLFYPRYMPEDAGPKAVTAGNAVLEVWTNAGVLGVVALGAIAVLFMVAVVRWWRTTERPQGSRRKLPEPPKDAAGKDTPPPVAWEFYFGGMLGLVLAFLLRAGHLPTDDVILEGVNAGIRAVVWFAVFGIFETVPWSGEELVGGLAAGVAAMFGCLLVFGGIDFPSVTVVLWLAVALAVATVAPEPSPYLRRGTAFNWLAVPVFVAVAFGYFAMVFYPVAASASALRRVLLSGGYFLDEMGKKVADRDLRDPPTYLQEKILGPLRNAQRDDADNTRLLMNLSAWEGQVWALSQPDSPALAQAMDWAKKAQKANPEGPDGPMAEMELRLRTATRFARVAKALREEKDDPKRPRAAREKQAAELDVAVRREYGEAAEVLERYLTRCEPREASLRCQLAAIQFEAGKSERAWQQVAEAERLDREAKEPRKLSDRQHEQIREWRNPKKAR